MNKQHEIHCCNQTKLCKKIWLNRKKKYYTENACVKDRKSVFIHTNLDAEKYIITHTKRKIRQNYICLKIMLLLDNTLKKHYTEAANSQEHNIYIQS